MTMRTRQVDCECCSIQSMTCMGPNYLEQFKKIKKIKYHVVQARKKLDTFSQ
jgi:hypothetical protein